MPGQWVAGAQSVVITPPVGVDLCGFGGRGGPSQGVHDELRAGALHLADGTNEALLITADLVGLHHEEVAQVRSGISDAIGIGPEAVMISCSHTHSGPATRCLNYLGRHDEAYLVELMRKLVGVGRAARQAAASAQVACARWPVSVGVNRRESRDGQIVLGVNEEGVTAPYVDVLYVDDLNGRPVARVFCHAAHAVTLGGDNLLISGDWPGQAQREVLRCYGDECVAMFMQGCCGNINSHPRGSFEVARAQGRTMAGAIAQADATAVRTSHGGVRAASVPVQLPLMPAPSIQEAQKLHDGCVEQAREARQTGNYGTKLMFEGLVQWAAEIVHIAQSGPAQRYAPFEVQALRVGDMAFVGLPGEVFVEYALNIDAASPLDITAVAAYTNGNVGYIPTARAYAEGGYETDSAIRFYGTTMPQPDSEQLILVAAAEALDEING